MRIGAPHRPQHFVQRHLRARRTVICGGAVIWRALGEHEAVVVVVDADDVVSVPVTLRGVDDLVGVAVFAAAGDACAVSGGDLGADRVLRPELAAVTHVVSFLSS